MGGKELGVWRSGKRYAFPTSPHPRLRLSIYKVSRATLTMNLVQKIGQTTTVRRSIGGVIGRYFDRSARSGLSRHLVRLAYSAIFRAMLAIIAILGRVTGIAASACRVGPIPSCTPAPHGGMWSTGYNEANWTNAPPSIGLGFGCKNSRIRHQSERCPSSSRPLR